MASRIIAIPRMATATDTIHFHRDFNNEVHAGLIDNYIKEKRADLANPGSAWPGGDGTPSPHYPGEYRSLIEKRLSWPNYICCPKICTLGGVFSIGLTGMRDKLIRRTRITELSSTTRVSRLLPFSLALT